VCSVLVAWKAAGRGSSQSFWSGKIMGMRRSFKPKQQTTQSTWDRLATVGKVSQSNCVQELTIAIYPVYKKPPSFVSYFSTPIITAVK
jgi:hypothetical protein